MKKKKTKMKARDIAQAIIRQENNASQTRLNQSDTEKPGCASDSGDAMSSNSGVPTGKGGIAKLRGVRSVSIQNTSTQVSSKSDTDEAKEAKKAGATRAVQSCGIAKVGRRKSLQQWAPGCSTTDKQKKDAPFAGDIMELISEEELSVCRSEGSPPRKKPKGNKERAA